MVLFYLALAGYIACVAVGFNYFMFVLKKVEADIKNKALNQQGPLISGGDIGLLVGGTTVFGALSSLGVFLLLKKYSYCLIK